MLDNKYRNILVAIDGSDEAERAFKEGVNIAKKNNSKLFLTHISDSRTLRFFPNFENPIGNREFMDQSQRAASATLDAYKKWALDFGFEDIETILKYGSPKIEIAKVIPEEFNIDLILLGATGLNAVERILIGSVSEYVVRNAPCDVLIVRTYPDGLEDEDRITDSNFK